MIDNLHASVAQHVFLRDQLRQQFPDEDDDGLADTLEGLSELPDQIAAVIRSCDLDIALIEGLEHRIKDLQGRTARLQRRVDTKRQLALQAMEQAELKRIEAYDATITLAALPAKVLITDQSRLPNTYLRELPPPEPTPDRPVILAALKAGIQVPGATLTNGGVRLSVRKS